MTPIARLRRLARRLASLVRRRRVAKDEADFDAEIADHLASAAAFHAAHGLTPEAAHRASVAGFGGQSGIWTAREAVRDVRRFGVFEDLVQDVRYAARSLAGARGFAVTALGTLALGIGANVAVFSVVNGVLLRPMPFRDPARLFAVSFAPGTGPMAVGPALLDVHFDPFRQSQTVFAALTAASAGPVGTTLTGAGDPVRLRAFLVAPNFFDVLGVPAASGRTFTTDEGRPGQNHVAIISHAMWLTRFGGDPAITARVIRLDGAEFHIIGIAPPGFTFPDHPDLWLPFEARPLPNEIRLLRVIGRLGPGVTVGEAQAAVAAFAANRRLVANDPSGRSWKPQVVPVRDLEVANSRQSLWIFAGAVAFVLLIACANVANLLLVRAEGRTRELAVRGALGASRGRLARQLLVESSLIGIVGGLIGLGVAFLAVRGLLTLAPANVLPRADMIRIDSWVVAFAIGLSCLTGIAFGLVPAMQTSGLTTSRALYAGGRTVTLAGERLRGALVVAEIALALALLTGAGLLLRSFARLAAIDPGFDPAHRVALSLSLPSSAYGTDQKIHIFTTSLLEELGSLDGVQSVAAVSERPLGPGVTMGDFQLADGRPLPPNWLVTKVCVSDGYFRTMGIPILRGREFTTDDGRREGVVIISESVARTLWPNGNAVGQRLSMEDHPTSRDWLTVVGIAADIHQQSLRRAKDAMTYEPINQTARTFFIDHPTFVIRSSNDSAVLTPAIRGAVRAIDPNLPIEQLAAMPDLVTATQSAPRFQTWLLGIFAGVALMLSAIGVAGVLACSVSRRTREIGIRRALGASASQIVGLVIRRTLALAISGIALGLAGAWAITHVLKSLLFEIGPHDPGAFTGASAGLLLVALVAAVAPAWRARSVDPVVTLRLE